MKRAISLVTLLAPWLVSACVPGEESTPALGPPRENWESVSAMLGANCGSLDCHGQSGRPLRLYDRRGLRLDAADVPGGGATTAAEHEENLHAVTGLEPEIMSRVLASGGLEPERLTLVRKALGIENHKGGRALTRGADGDVCLRSWLASAVDVDACLAAEDRERMP